MRRLLVPLFVVPALLLALAVPAAAAPPLKESGTSKSFTSISSTCSGASCTDVILDAFSLDNETILVCLNYLTYSTRTGQIRSQESGCTETSSDALTVTSDVTVSLDPTSITLAECGRRGCTETRTVTVSATDSAVGPVFSDVGRGTFSDGTCTFRYRFESRSAPIAGTMTIDGVTLEQSGGASLSEFTVSSRCG